MTEEEIREMLKASGKSLRQMEDESGIERSHIWRMKTGRMALTPRILDYLGVEKVVTYRRKDGGGKT